VPQYFLEIYISLDWIITQQTEPKNTQKCTLRPSLWRGYHLYSDRCHQRSLSSQSLGKYWQPNQNNQHAWT